MPMIKYNKWFIELFGKKLRIIAKQTMKITFVSLLFSEISRSNEIEPEEKYGCLEYRLPGSPFVVNSGRESATLGKVFGIRIMEELNALGYDLVVSSDLSRAYDQSTWSVYINICLIQIADITLHFTGIFAKWPLKEVDNQ